MNVFKNIKIARMDKIKEYIFLAIFGFLVVQNLLVMLNILFSPKWMKDVDWLTFPTASNKKLKKILYCLYAMLLFAMLFYWRL